ncbi:MAG: 2-phospho-L-lactate transferase [Thermomicrobiales bacterium]
MTGEAEPKRVVALAGGVGGAKLAHGLAMTGLGDRLSVIVNTGDDFILYGLHISPDLDTVLYTLGGVANPATGWGVVDDSLVTQEMLQTYGVDTWFMLGDKDLATHILRTERLRKGDSLTRIMADLARALGIEAQLLPMCDELVPTRVKTPDGLLDFQEYFVRRRHSDDVYEVVFQGIEHATVPATVATALAETDLIVICPSNPFVSVDPILSVPGLRDKIANSGAPVVAVSPIIGGEAVKGPAAQMLASLGHEVSALGVAGYYRDLIDVIVIDEVDRSLAPEIEKLGVSVAVTNTLMKSDLDRRALAAFTIDAGTRQFFRS